MGKNIQCPHCHKYQGHERDYFERGDYFRQSFICLACGHEWIYTEDDEGGNWVHIRNKDVSRKTFPVK